MDYRDENIWLMQGDCLERMKEIPDGSVDLVLTDPPYGTVKCSWDNIIPLEEMWVRVGSVKSKTTPVVLFGSQPFTSMLISSNTENFKYDWVWVKNKRTGFLNSKRQPLRSKEDVLVFYEKQCLYNPQKTTGHKPVNYFTKNTSDGDTVGATKKISGGGSTERYPINILKFPVVNQDGTSDGGNFHPTQKPVALLEYLIKTYTNEGDTVLDFTAGSMSTAVACINTNRKCIMIEKDEHFYNVGKERVMKALQDKERILGG